MPLEYLTEHTGAEYPFGSGPDTVKIPMIMDECIRNMRNKGILLWLNVN